LKKGAAVQELNRIQYSKMLAMKRVEKIAKNMHHILSTKSIKGAANDQIQQHLLNFDLITNRLSN
jgi:hypothetical protein